MRSPWIVALFVLASCTRPAQEIRVPLAVGASPPAVPARPVVPANNPAVGGVILPSDKPITDDLTAAPNLGGFVRAVRAAGLADTLRGAGPFTVFAPTDAAFERLQPGTVDALFKPENNAALTKLVGLHVVAERLGGVQLMQRIAAGGGRATLSTVAGEPITVTMTGGIVTLTDAGGNKSYVETADVRGVNGVIHVVNGVLVPRLN